MRSRAVTLRCRLAPALGLAVSILAAVAGGAEAALWASAKDRHLSL